MNHLLLSFTNLFNERLLFISGFKFRVWCLPTLKKKPSKMSTWTCPESLSYLPTLFIGAAKLHILFLNRKTFFVFFTKKILPLLHSPCNRTTLSKKAPSLSFQRLKREGKDSESFPIRQKFLPILLISPAASPQSQHHKRNVDFLRAQSHKSCSNGC